MTKFVQTSEMNRVMKEKWFLTCVALWLLVATSWAQGGWLVTGIVKDKETRQALANVNISVQGTNIGTVTNADGVFSLKASLDELGRGVVVSHLGYQNALVSAEVLTDQDKRPTIWLSPKAVQNSSKSSGYILMILSSDGIVIPFTFSFTEIREPVSI